VETKQIVSSNSKVILTRQTCGQRSGMATGSKRRAIACYFPVRICYMFPISKFRGELDLGLCMTLVLANRIPLRSADFRRILRPNTFKNRKSALRSDILFASTKCAALTDFCHNKEQITALELMTKCKFDTYRTASGTQGRLRSALIGQKIAKYVEYCP